MFTGLVEGFGRLERVDRQNAGHRLTIAWPELPPGDPLKLGESVAVSGCCLSIVSAVDTVFEVQAGPETLARTNLAERTAGDRVNLERALKVGDRLGGHFVQGHVDTTALLRARCQRGEWDFLEFDIDPHWTKLMISKGSVALDGVSLTLIDVGNEGFSVMLIPQTLSVTTFGTTQPGQRVNVEIDIFAKYVQKLLGQ